MKNGELRMKNGELRMKNGEWRMKNGEWKIENGIAPVPSFHSGNAAVESFPQRTQKYL